MIGNEISLPGIRQKQLKQTPEYDMMQLHFRNLSHQPVKGEL
jgi:hypothetical protein